jgi:hypothetical protein
LETIIGGRKMIDNDDDKIVNTKMFYAIADVIETYPDKHDQEQWFEHFGHVNVEGPVKDTVIYDGVKYECDTNQCIAGWTVILDGNKVSFHDQYLYLNGERHTDTDLINKAADILGIDYEDAHLLFYTMDMEYDWPRLLRSIGDGMSVGKALDEQW